MNYYIFPADKPLHFVNIGTFSGGNDYIHDKRIIGDYEVFAVQNGRLYMEQDNVRYETEAGQMLFQLPHVMQRGYQEHYVNFYWMHFTCHAQPLPMSETELSAILDKDASYLDGKIAIPQELNFSNWDKSVVLFGQLFNSARSFRRQTECDYMITTIMLDISNQAIEQLRHDAHGSDVKLAAILTYIEDNKHLPLTVQEVAEQFEYNEKYFSQFFKNKMGMSPKKFITRKKIDFAKAILVSTVHSVGDVARFVGYEDEHLFMRIFKQETGTTPSHYRNLFSEQR